MLSIEAILLRPAQGIQASDISMVAPYVVRRRNSCARVAQQSRRHVYLQVAPYEVALDHDAAARASTCREPVVAGLRSCSFQSRLSYPLNVGSAGPATRLRACASKSTHRERPRMHPGSSLPAASAVPISQEDGWWARRATTAGWWRRRGEECEESQHRPAWKAVVSIC